MRGNAKLFPKPCNCGTKVRDRFLTICQLCQLKVSCSSSIGFNAHTAFKCSPGPVLVSNFYSCLPQSFKNICISGRLSIGKFKQSHSCLGFKLIHACLGIC